MGVFRANPDLSASTTDFLQNQSQTFLNATSDPSSPPRNTRLLVAFQVRDYLYLWLGMLGSAFAMNMQQVAQGWLVYEMTSSAVQLTRVTLSFMLLKWSSRSSVVYLPIGFLKSLS